jgi:SNF2 family DNA or RNA helicase
MIDWSRAATIPRQHQIDGVEALLKRPMFMLADEVGSGKSKQVIDAAQILYEQGEIDTVVVLCPAFARGVWGNPNPALGEVAKHGWPSVQNWIFEYSTRDQNPSLFKSGHLNWLVTNYEFIRREERLEALLKVLANRRYWVICDEAWSLKDAKTAQWKAANAIRKLAKRITLLNGSPIADSPLDLFAQMKILTPALLGYKYFSHFRSRYALLRPNVSFPMIIGFQNLEELREKVSPYVLRRLTRDCHDLPPILEPVLIEAKLSDKNWALYRAMRDEMVAWLKEGEASIARQAIVKGMRLAQITSGFLGGIEQLDLDGDLLANVPDNSPKMAIPLQEIGQEKLDALLEWLKTLSPQPERLLVWGRFRAEVERAGQVFAEQGERRVHLLYGQQPRDEREAAVAALNPAIEQSEPVVVIGNPLAGGAALNLAGASVAVYLSNDFSLRVRVQSLGRIDRPGQQNAIRYCDVVATGPKGQATIDSHILAALRGKDDVARWSVATWRKKLLEE